MAEKKVIVDIDIKSEDIANANSAMKKAREETIAYNQQLNELKKQQKELNDSYKKGETTASAYAKQQTKIKEQITGVNKNLREANKSIQNNKTVVDAARGSNEQLRARLALLTKQYNGLSKEQRENSKQGKQLQATIKGISDKLKANEKAVGDNRRNVGNYESALKGVAGQINVMGVNLGSLASQLKLYKEGVVASAAATKASAAATGGLSGAMNILKVALIGTGIGALVIALGSLITFLTQTKRGSELLAQGLSAIGATVSVLTDRMSQLGEALIKVFSGDFTGAAEQASGAFKGITEEIVNETKAAAGLEKQMQKLRDRERELTVSIANRKAEVAELQLIAEDETKSFEERQKAIEKANAIQKEQMEQQLELQRERVRITEEQLALGENLEEDEQKLAEERAKLGEIEAANLKKLRTLKAKENSIARQISAENTKRANEQRKLTEEQIKAEEEAEEKRAAIREAFRREQLTELERRKEDALKKASILREAGEEEKVIEEYLSQELIEIHREEQDQILQAKLTRLEQDAAAAKAKVNAEIESELARKAAILQIESELAEAKQQELDLEIQNYTASTEQMGFIDSERNAQLLESKAIVDAQVVELDNQKTSLLEENARRLSETQKATNQEYVSAASAGLGTIGNIVQRLADQSKDNIKQIEAQGKAAGKTDAEIQAMTKKAKKEAHDLQVAAAIVQTLQGAISAYSSAAATPIVGSVLGPVAAAAALAFGFANVAKMKQEKFEDGGVVNGPSHAQGGVPFTVQGQGGYEMEGQEIILTKGVYKDPKLFAAASAINVAGGGVPLAPSMYMAAGGIASPTFAARQAASNNNTIESQISALGDRIENIQPIVRVTDINRVNQQTAQVQQSADL